MATPYDYTVDGLITSVRDDVGISPNSEDGTDARLLRFLNKEQSLYLTKLLTNAEAKHRESVLDLTITASLVYDIPTRAIAAGLVKVEGIDGSGNTWMLFESKENQTSSWWPRNGSFYVQGNQVIFYAPPPVGTLRLTYNRRLSFLVQTSAVGVISAINTGTKAVTVTGSPPAGLVSGAAFDLVRANPHFDILTMDSVATLAGSVFTFTNALPTGLAVGDYVCAAGQSPVCQAPLELHPVLAQRVAFKWLEAKGDERVQTAASSLKQMEDDAAELIEPRIERETPFSNPNAPGWGAQWRGFRG